MKQKRFDRTFIKDYQETDEGFLTVRAVVTRPGVFPYQRSDGTVQYELKHPEDIFSDRTIQSVNAKSVTDDHPPEPVTTQNVSRFGKGLSHGDAAVRNNGIMVTFTIYDAELIQKVMDGEKEEISLGFETEVVAEEGTYENQSYQFRQTNIDVNHIAVVEEGRVGPEAAIRGDSGAWQIDSNNNGGGNMPKIRIDNADYEVDTAVKSRIEALQTKADSYDQVKSEYDTLKAQSDAKDTQIQNLQQQVNDSQNNPSQEKIDQAVQERIQLVDTARDFLDDSFEYQQKSDQDIKVAVIQSQDSSFKADDKSDEYINARYDATVSLLQNQSQPATGENNMKFTSQQHNDSIEKKRQQRVNMKDVK